MQGVGIAVAMRRATPAAAEQRLRDNYGQPIRVWPATDQPIGFPIVLIEPNDPLNHAALGYDMYSEPIRRAPMPRAWQTGRDRQSVGEGKSVSVRVMLGGRRIIKKKNNQQ